MAIALASSDIENYCRRILVVGTYTEEQELIVDNKRRMVVPLSQYPILSLAALSVSLVGNTVPYSLNVIFADTLTPPERFVYYPLAFFPSPLSPLWWGLNQQSAGVVSVTYSAGFSPIPADVFNAALLLTLSYLSRDANPLGATSISTGMGDQTRFELLDTDRNAKKAYQLLDVYVRRYT